MRARPDPPPRLSRHRRRTLIAAREIKSPISPPLPPASGSLADDTPPPYATHDSPTKLVAGSRRAATTTASALPLAELAAVGPEIAEVAITCFSITLVGLAVGFVLLRVEAAVEGEE